ncbi:(2Fe-2S)-binding protein [Xanthobacter dioxanivorans]|uniref:(2Fe-2S)-binding protein n=1 Tax=Xanthobacter dioxanivorans TaxID=2528964 RepID=A0A974PRK1_9HYPH|nr:(2Fe-2S)-binding protein [Xanthobacter dioxanivorans]QRG08443.1 (2Fe-2S)-binding protein [Xanthobacter dioxanivorans]
MSADTSPDTRPDTVHDIADASDVVTVTVNGVAHRFALPRTTPLLYVLRNDLALNGPKFGCGLGECGACTVLVDGVAARACVMRLGTAEGRNVTTLEGLGTPERPHPVQAAFIAEQAAQCGYCLNGMIMTTAAFLARTPDPTPEEARQALRYNLCRCGTHVEILKAVLRAAREMGAAAAGEGVRD